MQLVLLVLLVAAVLGINAFLLTQVDAVGAGMVVAQSLSIAGLLLIAWLVIARNRRRVSELSARVPKEGQVRFQVLRRNSTPMEPEEAEWHHGFSRNLNAEHCFLVPENPLSEAMLRDLRDGNAVLEMDLVLPDIPRESEEIKIFCSLVGNAMENGRQVLELVVSRIC